MEAKEIRRIARENLVGNWGLSIIVAMIAYILGGMLTGTSFVPDIDVNIQNQNISSLSDLADYIGSDMTVIAGASSTLGIVQLIIGGAVQLGHARFLLNQHDRKDPQLHDLFSGFDRFSAGFCQSFLRGLYVFLWSLLFVIPGIVAAFSYAMTPYIMEDNPDMTASEAIAASKEMMNGHKLDLFWLELTFIGWDILCALTLNLGNIALNPYKNAAQAAFYRNICTLNQPNTEPTVEF